MRSRFIHLLAIAFAAVQAAALDLSRVDRSIQREPAYAAKAGYCLLVFGPEAKTRVWIIKDRETIYVDRNADGDLTEPGEAFKPSSGGLNHSSRAAEFQIGALTPADGTGPHSDFKINAYSEDGRAWKYVLKLKVNGKVQQFAGWNTLFEETPQTARILHFGGALAAQPIRYPKFSLKETKPELHLRFMTPGLGDFSTVSLGYETIPPFIQPVAEIQWPGSEERTKVTLLSRC